MANNSDDIRRLMKLMESAQNSTLLEGWVDSLKSKLGGNMGAKQRKEMAGELSKEWYEWLGRTNRQGTLTDMTRFMTHRIGFNDQDIDIVLKNSGFGPQEVDDAEQEAEDQPSDQAPAPKAQPANDAFDPEEGVPLPKDLENTKLSDHAKYGLDVEKADDEVETKEIVEDPRKYQQANGEWDRKKISAKLGKLPPGSKLTLGKSTFSRTVGSKATKFANDKNESINEAGQAQLGDNDVLPKKVVAQIMDASAAQVNDEYLLNGPERDKDAAYGQGAGNGHIAGQPGTGAPQGKAGKQQATPNQPGKSGSGQYNADEMVTILKTDFQITNAKSFVDSLTRKVMNSGSISAMTDNDMHDLALLGWALIRARN